MKAGFIAVVGRPNVGKSTLINKLVSEKVAIVSDKAGTTRDNIKGILNLNDNQYIFIDTPGIHKAKHLLGEYMTNSAIRILKDIGMYEKLHEYASNLPYGDQRKLEIARAIATGAKIILLDEPAAGMNPQESQELLQFIKKLKEDGFTIIMIEHDMSVVMNISDRIYVIDYGKRIADGKPEEIAKNPKVISAYLGGEL